MGDRPLSVIFIGLFWFIGSIFYIVFTFAKSAEIIEAIGPLLFFVVLMLHFLNLIIVFYVFQMKKVGLVVITSIFVLDILLTIKGCMSGSCTGSIIAIAIRGYLIVALWKHFDKMSWGFDLRYRDLDTYND